MFASRVNRLNVYSILCFLSTDLRSTILQDILMNCYSLNLYNSVEWHISNSICLVRGVFFNFGHHDELAIIHPMNACEILAVSLDANC